MQDSLLQVEGLEAAYGPSQVLFARRGLAGLLPGKERHD